MIKQYYLNSPPLGRRSTPTGGGGRENNKIPINHKNKEFFLTYHPALKGTPPPTGGGEWR